MEERKQNETFYGHSLFKCCTEENLVWRPIFAFCFFIPVYVSFIIVKKCGFVMGLVILEIYF